MGLFSKIKNELAMEKKDSSLNEVMDRALQHYNNGPFHEVFPVGRYYGKIIAKSMATIFDLDIYTCDEDTLYSFLTFFAIVYAGRKNGCRDSEIVLQLNDHNPGLINNRLEVAFEIVAYWHFYMDHYYLKTPSLQLMEEDIPKLKKSAEFLKLRSLWTETNRVVQLKYVDDVEYGIVPEKPIFTTGFTAMKNYFANLRSALGEAITWERIDSVSGDGVQGPVERISIKLASGKQYGTLYVSWNGTINPNKAPVGFILASN